ncbi:MAG TPA: protein kinase [Burkholderiales bacterium]|nr:protein kinase [Burkholderiales bacterium]
MTLPERLGKYEVVEALGESANAEVFGAFDPDVNRVVTVKTVRKDLAQLDGRAARALARWRNESRLAGRLSHPGIVGVYDYGEAGSVAYLAVEFVQGHRLGDYLDRGIRFGEADAVSILAQVLDALQHAHEHGVRHGAVNPASILVARSGEAKLADFGCAPTEDGGGQELDEETGVPGYIAPEEYAREGVDARADLFGAGAVFFRLLTGRPAYPGSAEQVAYRVSRGSTPLPSQADAGRGWERYDDVVSRALARDPAERFQTASEFRHALLDVYGAPLAAVSADVLIKESVRDCNRFEPGDPPSRPQWATGRNALNEAQLQAHLTEDPVALRKDLADNRWRVALVVAVVLIALAVVAALATWTEPEHGPRASRPDRTPAPVPDTTTAAPAHLTEREAEPDTTGRDAPHADAPSPGIRAVAQADHRTVERSAATARPAASAETQSASPAPDATEPPSVQSIVAAQPKAAAAPGPQAAATRADASAPPEAPTGFWRDQAISFQVATKLGFDRSLYRSQVHVESAAGVVTLRGHVPSREDVAHAIAVARGVYGVREVRSELRVGAPDYVFPDPTIGLR